MKKEDGFFNRMLTKEEWDNPDLMRFSNAEIPASDIELGTRLDEIIEQEKLPDTLPTHAP
jgi:hypothetical protein